LYLSITAQADSGTTFAAYAQLPARAWEGVVIPAMPGASLSSVDIATQLLISDFLYY